jgi:hypothetical protein
MRTRSTLHLLACSLIILLTIIAGTQSVSAGPPQVDAGGPGGGSAEGETPVLIGSGQERETVAAADTPIVANVVDETAITGVAPADMPTIGVAQADMPTIGVAQADTQIASTGDATVSEATASFEDLLAASHTGHVAQSQNQQSIARSESTLVQNAIAAAEQAPQAMLPNQSAF